MSTQKLSQLPRTECEVSGKGRNYITVESVIPANDNGE